MAAMSRPLTRTWPKLGSISRLSSRISVDLPEPDRPMMQKISPRRTSIEASETPTTQPNSFSTSCLPRPRPVIAPIASRERSPKTFHTDRQSIRTSVASLCVIPTPPHNVIPMGERAAPIPDRPPAQVQ